MNSTTNIKFSIIIPLYNKEKWIAETIESVLNQSYDNYELIIVDDESTDNSTNIVRNFAQKNKKIKLISQKNGGAYKARITGLKAAIGDYVVCIDGDDIMHRDYLWKAYDCIVESDSDMVLCQISKELDFSKPQEDYSSIMSAENPADELREQLLLNDCWNGVCVKIVRKCVLNLDDDFIVNPVNYVPMGEDKLLSLFYMDSVRRLAVVNEPLYYYRQQTDSGCYIRATEYTASGFDKIYMLEQGMLHYAIKWYGADEAKRLMSEFYRTQVSCQVYRILTKSASLKSIKKNFKYIKSLETYRQSLKYYPQSFSGWKLQNFYKGYYLMFYAWAVLYRMRSKAKQFIHK